MNQKKVEKKKWVWGIYNNCSKNVERVQKKMMNQECQQPLNNPPARPLAQGNE
jgi:hypothetical protein